MSTPNIETLAFGYTLTFDEEQIVAKVSLIHAHRDGRVTAEVEWTTIDGGYLHESQFNLSASSTMKQQAKYLAQRDSEANPGNSLTEAQWGTLVESVCRHTKRLTRVGEEAKEIWPQGEDIPPPKYLLFPVLQENQVNLIFGDKQAGKTQESMLFCAVIGLPWHDNPFGFGVPSNPVKTLWLDWETDEESFNYLYNELQRGMGMVLPPIYYRHCKSSLPNDIEQIAHWVEKTKATFIVVDHIGLAAGGPLNDDITATGYFAAIRQLNVTSLHLGHQSKDPNTKKKSTFGSAFWEFIPRTIWELKKLSDSEDTLDTVMTLTKRNIGIKPPPFGMRFSYNGAGTHVEKFNPNDIAEFVQQTSASNRIYLYLKKGQANSTAIYEELGIPKDTVYKTLKRMEQKGTVIKVGSDYALVRKDE